MNYRAESHKSRCNAARHALFFNDLPDWRPISAAMRREVPGTILMNNCLSSEQTCVLEINRKAGRGPL
jgi:hypothetical protein